MKKLSLLLTAAFAVVTLSTEVSATAMELMKARVAARSAPVQQTNNNRAPNQNLNQNPKTAAMFASVRPAANKSDAVRKQEALQAEADAFFRDANARGAWLDGVMGGLKAEILLRTEPLFAKTQVPTLSAKSKKETALTEYAASKLIMQDVVNEFVTLGGVSSIVNIRNTEQLKSKVLPVLKSVQHKISLEGLEVGDVNGVIDRILGAAHPELMKTVSNHYMVSKHISDVITYATGPERAQSVEDDDLDPDAFEEQAYRVYEDFIAAVIQG